MILDAQGNPLRRTIGFVARYEPVRKAQAQIGALFLVGFQISLEEDDEEDDAARNRNRMRRAA